MFKEKESEKLDLSPDLSWLVNSKEIMVNIELKKLGLFSQI